MYCLVVKEKQSLTKTFILIKILVDRKFSFTCEDFENNKEISQIILV
jgi:hypothetical protein